MAGFYYEDSIILKLFVNMSVSTTTVHSLRSLAQCLTHSYLWMCICAKFILLRKNLEFTTNIALHSFIFYGVTK